MPTDALRWRGRPGLGKALIRTLALLGLLASSWGTLPAQEPSPAGDQLQPEDRLRVFLECESCDFDHVRLEIGFVDYVRNREDADVLVIVTTLETGSGGTEYTLEFIGRERLEGTRDTLRATSGQTDTEYEARDLLTHTLGIGLAHYSAREGLAGDVRVLYEEPEWRELGRTTTSDPWDYWVFQVAAGGSADAQEAQGLIALSGSASANRTTDDWKLNLKLGGDYGRSKFTLNDGSVLISETSTFESDLLVVASVDEHWSVGGRAETAASTFRNVDLTVRLAPAVEYNIFPYSESTRHQFRLQFSMGVQHFDYTEITIFDKTEETLLSSVLTVYFDSTQPWGTGNLALEASAYLHDLSKNRLELFGGVDIRLVRGLALSFYGSASHITDQLNLARSGATDEEILLRLKELETTFDYSLFVGLSFTFGSIYNNVVNPRFTG
jgi:hypothetical protein